MITRHNFFAAYCGLFFLMGCADNRQSAENTIYAHREDEQGVSVPEMKEKATDLVASTSVAESPATYVGSQAATDNPNTANRKFIRTAEMRIRVKNVYQYSLQTEDAITQLGGFVTYSQLQNTHDYTQTLPFSKDSVIEIMYYTVSNQITAKVPTPLLDSTLRLLAKGADYIDYRTIRAEDVTLRQKANNLTIDRAKTYNNTSRQEDRDQAKIDNMRLEDDIKWATVNIWLYQRQTFLKQVVFNPEQNQLLEPSFGQKFVNALSDSVKIMEEVILFFVRIWLLIGVLIACYIGYRAFQKRKSKQM